ncbi:MAG: HAD hydrolase family protein [Lentisphaerae bacterium]|nr:HAD hydrolase family protein [Lentisphaerota bacterium]
MSLSPSKGRALAYSGHCRVIISDVDGTFLNNQKQPQQPVIDAVRDALAAGIPFLFASGRMYGAIATWVDGLGLSAPQIVSNGAEVILPAGRRHLYHQHLSTELVNWLMDQGMQGGFEPILFSGDQVLCHTLPRVSWLIERNNEWITIKPEAELRRPELVVDKLIFLADTRADELVLFRDHLAREAKIAGLDINAAFSERGILNVATPLASKIIAAKIVCDYLGCSLADAMAVGDGDNDAELLAGVGLGVAMGNATDNSRAAALVQVSDNEHDGLAEAIRRFAIASEVP